MFIFMIILTITTHYKPQTGTITVYETNDLNRAQRGAQTLSNRPPSRKVNFTVIIRNWGPTFSGGFQGASDPSFLPLPLLIGGFYHFLYIFYFFPS